MNADDTSSFADATPLTPNSPISIKREGESTALIDQRTGMVTRSGRGNNETMRIEILKTSMPAFVEYLTPLMDHPVVDATDLKGFYKMTMELPPQVYLDAFANRAPSDLALSSGTTPFSGPVTSAPGRDRPAGNASDPSGKPIFSAVEKLGLKLDPRKAPIRMLIIEQVEKNPNEN